MKILKNYGGFNALFLGVVAIIMLFISPALTYTLGNVSKSVNVSGFETIFGATREGSKILEFNFLGFLALIFLVAGLVIPLVPLPANIKYLIGALLLLVSGIFFFVFPGTHEIALGKYSANTTLIIAGVSILLGFIIDAVLGFLNFKK